MSSTVPISTTNLTAPTPQNTPLTHAPIAAGLSRPTVPDIKEDNEPDEDAAPEGDLEATMVDLVQGRLSSLIGKSSGYIENLPVEVKKNIEALKGIQLKQQDLQNKYKRECLELEKKYLELQRPLYERRYDIVTGSEQPSKEEVEAGEKHSQKEDPDYTPLPSDIPETKDGIPEFWLTALRNHLGISELITDRDAGALKHLTDLSLSYISNDEPKPGFKILFKFTPNDYFENEVLEKTYLYREEVGYSGDFVYDSSIGTDIKWKEDKDLTKEFEIKKQRNKNTNRTRLVRKAKPTQSFFNFFSPPALPSDETIENGEIDEDELDEIEEKLEIDYQIGEDLKEKIIPHAIDYFTGKALEYDDLDGSDDDFDVDDEDDDIEESDSEPEVPARRRAPPKGRGGAPANTNPEECKQQ